MSLSATHLRLLRLLGARCHALPLHSRHISTSSALLQQVAPSVAPTGGYNPKQGRFPPRRPRFPPRPTSSTPPSPPSSKPAYPPRPHRPAVQSSPPLHNTAPVAPQPVASPAAATDSKQDDTSHLSPWDVLKGCVIVPPEPTATLAASTPATAASPNPASPTPKYTFTPPSPARPELFVNTPQQLRALVSILSEAPVVAIDTEFLTFPTHRPALHVFQIASSAVIAVIDYQTLSERSVFLPFVELLLTREQVILHSAQGDMGILYDLCAKYGVLPQLANIRMFDTQMAAAYCGYGDMIGYGKLLAELYGVYVNKSDQMTDWSRRPLTPQQVQYAINDVRYLHAVYDDLSRELRDKGRWEWAAEEMAAIPNQLLYAPVNPREAWRTVWGAKKLDEHSDELSVLRELCEWREMTARARNQAVNLIMRDDAMVAAAQQMPSTMQQLEAVQGIKLAVVMRYGRQLLEAVKRGRQGVGEARAELYHRAPHKQAMRLKEGLFNLLTSRTAAVAQTHGISQFQIAPRNELLDLASVSAEAIQRVKRIGQEGGVRREDMRPVRMISNYYGVKHEMLPFELSTAPRALYAARTQPVETAESNSLSRALSVEEEVEMLCKLKVLSGWRRELVGNDLLEVACGESIAWDSDKQSATVAAEQPQQQQKRQNAANDEQRAVEAEAAGKQRAEERMATLRATNVDARRLLTSWLDALSEQERVSVYATVGAIVQSMDGAATSEAAATNGGARLLDVDIVSEVRELVTRTLAMQPAAESAARKTAKSRKKKEAAPGEGEAEGTTASEGEAIDKPRVRRTKKKAVTDEVHIEPSATAVEQPVAK